MLYRGYTSYITLMGMKKKSSREGLCWILWNFQLQKMCRSSSTLSLSRDIHHFHQHPLSGTRIARAFCWDAPSLEYPSLSDQKKGVKRCLLRSATRDRTATISTCVTEIMLNHKQASSALFFFLTRIKVGFLARGLHQKVLESSHGDGFFSRISTRKF